VDKIAHFIKRSQGGLGWIITISSSDITTNTSDLEDENHDSLTTYNVKYSVGIVEDRLTTASLDTIARKQPGEATCPTILSSSQSIFPVPMLTMPMADSATSNSGKKRKALTKYSTQ
jgi:hypothetical protein